VRVTVVVNAAGQVIAALIPVSSQGSESHADEEGGITGFVPSEGQDVVDLDLPDEDVPTEPGPDFLNTLQMYKDRGSPEASS
jgi:hypothetical protein